MRKQIFETIRAQRGKGFTADEVKAIDALLDRLGLEKDEKEEAPAPLPVAAPVAIAATNGDVGLHNEQAFFDELRSSGIFGKGLKADQVKGLQTVCNAAKAANWPLAFTAYALATACHETAYTMQPVREGLRASDTWRRKNLRYYPYYGRGYVQLTWEDNYKKADRELDLNGQLTGNHDLALDPDIAAKIMVRGMQEGWFAGDKSGKRHTLARHLPANGAASVAQMTAARRIINGTDKNTKIAAEAMKFQKALQAGGW